MVSYTFFSFRGNFSSARLSSLLKIWTKVWITPHFCSSLLNSVILYLTLFLIVVFNFQESDQKFLFYSVNFPLCESWWEAELSSYYTRWKYQIHHLLFFSVFLTAERQSGDLELANYTHVLDFELEISDVKKQGQQCRGQPPVFCSCWVSKASRDI